MKKWGALIALTAAILAGIPVGLLLISQADTSAFPGVRTRFQADWLDLLFPLLTIAFAAWSLKAKTRIPALLLIISSLLGMALAMRLVGLFMLVSLVGGVLACGFCRKKEPESSREKGV